MNSKNFSAVVMIALGIVVLASLGLTFTSPGHSIAFLGMHLGNTDSHFIPPLAGALTLVGGIVVLLVKPKKV
jgi:hypothetical protein